jgi:hypothetical protein
VSGAGREALQSEQEGCAGLYTEPVSFPQKHLFRTGNHTQLQEFPLKSSKRIPATKRILPFTPRRILLRVLFQKLPQQWVRLKEFQIYRPGTHNEIEIRKAEDIFASLEARNRSIPNGGRLSKASFQIKFSDSKTPRTVTLSSGNRAQFKRDDDADRQHVQLPFWGSLIHSPSGN